MFAGIRQKGFSLLEVLIAFAIIMISVVSLVSLHRYYIKSELNASMMSSAMHLAESKLDDLRMFDSVETSAGVTAYNDIATNSGGTITSGAHTIAGNNFTLNWSVTDSALSGFTLLKDTTIYPSRDVTVNVSWTDSEGVSKLLSLSGVVSSIVDVNSEEIDNSSIASGEEPQVNYTPGDAPDVIAVSLGAQLKQETTKPFPKVDSANGSSGVKVNFQNITYNTNNNTQVMVDTTTASCDCRFSSDYAGGGVSKLTTIPATPESLDGLLYWNTKQDNKSYWGVYANSNLTPPEYSVSATQSQTSVCDACCENHFKGSGSTLESYYNPFIYNSSQSSDYYLGKYTAATAVSSTPSPVYSGSYIDSCRVMRVDGYYSRVLTDATYNADGSVQSVINYHYGQLLPDWNLIKLNVMSYDFLSKAKNQENYVKYIKYVIEKYIDFQKSNAGSLSGAAANLASTAIQDSTSPYYIKSFQEWLQVSGNVTNGGDTSLDVYSDDLASYQLIARGIFVDLLPNSWLVDTISAAQTTATDDSWLSLVSFSDVNLTLLSRWSSDTPSIVDVSDEAIKDMKTADYNSAYYGTYKRGELSIPRNSTGSATITVHSLRGNASISVYRDSSGNEIGVNPYENSNAITSSLKVTVGTALPANRVLISGKVYCYDRTESTDKNGKTTYAVDVCSSSEFEAISQPIISNYSGSPAICTLDEDVTSSAYRMLRCEVDKNSSLTISFTDSGSSLTGISTPYAITSYPLVFDSTSTAASSSSTCLQVYDANISSTGGIKLPKCN